MKNDIMTYLAILIVLIIFLICLLQFGIFTTGTESHIITDPFDQQRIKVSPFYINESDTHLVFESKLPDVPDTLSLYRGKIESNGSIDILIKNQNRPGNFNISEEEAPDFAKEILKKYNGLPSDAFFSGVETHYTYTHNSSSGKFIASTPTDMTVYYSRQIDGYPIVGTSDRIIIELDKNGEALWIYKYWRTLENTNQTVSIIPLTNAIEKLKNNEIIEKPRDLKEVTIRNISLGYYERDRSEPEIIFEPVWIFSGITSSRFPSADKTDGSQVTLVVSATSSSELLVESSSGENHVFGMHTDETPNTTSESETQKASRLEK